MGYGRLDSGWTEATPTGGDESSTHESLAEFSSRTHPSLQTLFLYYFSVFCPFILNKM